MRLDERIEAAGATVIHVSGEVDMDTHRALEEAIVGVVRRRGGPVVVDLADVSFLDSSGVRALLPVRQEALAHHTAVTVRNPQRMVHQVLHLAQVAPLLGLAQG
jgi:anti-sigma B factor antagonist